MLHQLKVLLAAIQDLHQYLARKQREINDAEELVRHATQIRPTPNRRQLVLLNHALKTPSARYTVESHQRSHGVSYKTARSDLLGLVKRSILRQAKEGRSFVFFPYQKLMKNLAG